MTYESFIFIVTPGHGTPECTAHCETSQSLGSSHIARWMSAPGSTFITYACGGPTDSGWKQGWTFSNAGVGR